MTKSMTTDFAGKIGDYQKAFQRLKNDFLLQTAIVSEITVFQIATKVDQILSETIDSSKWILLPRAFEPPSDCAQVL
jgi:hypothetical protein